MSRAQLSIGEYGRRIECLLKLSACATRGGSKARKARGSKKCERTLLYISAIRGSKTIDPAVGLPEIA